MPLFKKVNIDNGSMLEIHRRSLRRCRPVFLKDLDISSLMEHMATDEGFRQEQRETILACPTREQRVVMFLDHLESRGERAFGLFVEALKSRYKQLSAYLEETIQSVDEWDMCPSSNKASVNGLTLRRMLAKRRNELVAQTSEDADNLTDKISDLQDGSSNYISSYSVTTKGHLQKEKWIMHYSSFKPETVEKDEKSYMAVVCANLVFKRIDWSAVNLPADFKKPPSNAYMFERESTYVYVPSSRQTGYEAEDSSVPGAKKRDKTEQGNNSDVQEAIPVASFRIRSSVPPPVPPKPENLPVLGLGGSLPPPKQPHTESDILNVAPPPRTTSKISLPNGKIRPPVPKKKPRIRFPKTQSVAASFAMQTKLPVVPALPSTLEVNNESECCRSVSVADKVDLGDDAGDIESLDYNISLTSTLEPDDIDDLKIGTDTGSSLNNKDCLYRDNFDINKNKLQKDVVPVEEKAEELQLVELLMPGDLKQEEMMRNEQDPGNTAADKQELTANALGCPVIDISQASLTDESEVVSVQYDLPPREDAKDESPRQTENDSDSPNARADPQRVILPMRSVDQPVFADDEFSSDNSYYEEIEQFYHGCPSPSAQSCNSYLDPHMSLRKRASYRSSCHYALDELRRSSRRLLSRNSLVLVDCSFSSSDSKSLSDTANVESNSQSSNGQESDVFIGTTLCFDKEGCSFYVPNHFLKKYGDPVDAVWFYPVNMTSRQASLFLSSVRQEGCFVVYRPEDSASNAAYNLSVCLANGDVVHYHILENVRGDFGIEGHDHTFMTVGDLVEYFRRNKSSLATRLRRPLRCAKYPITPGYHYDLRYELNRNDLSLTGNIIGQGNFGVVCAGTYRNASVAVKVLQKSDNLTAADEDDFIEEALAMMELRHDHIVRLIGVSCKIRPFFLVTEYMTKGNLKDCLRYGLIPSDNIDALFGVCIQIVSAMLYLENLHYMLHRDLAARNFLVDEQLNIKLADFGRARLVSDDYYQAPRTEKICIKWAAPEVLIYSHYSTKSDVWALGVVFWEVFSAGMRPYYLFSGEQAAMYVSGGGRLDKPHGCPQDLYEVMKSCWYEEPDDRPSFADLDEIIKSKTSVYYSKPPVKNLDLRQRQPDASKLSVNFIIQKNQSRKSTTSSVSGGTKLPKPAVQDNKSNKCETVNENLIRRKSDPRYILNHEGPLANYLSDLSIATVSSEIIELDREDVSRGDRIRKSLRKLMNKKSKTKLNELGAKSVTVSQDYPAIL